MTKYCGFCSAAMLIDKKTLETIAAHFPEETFESHNEMAQFLYEAGIVDGIQEFTGSTHLIEDSGEILWDKEEEDFCNDLLVYWPLRYQPGLFFSSYYDMESIINELKKRLGDYLPADYDYRKRLRFIVGSYYG